MIAVWLTAAAHPSGSWNRGRLPLQRNLAMAATGPETDIRKLRAEGLQPLLLGLMAFLPIAGFSLALVSLTT